MGYSRWYSVAQAFYARLILQRSGRGWPPLFFLMDVNLLLKILHVLQDIYLVERVGVVFLAVVLGVLLWQCYVIVRR